jgi:hypothetical protein
MKPTTEPMYYSKRREKPLSHFHCKCLNLQCDETKDRLAYRSNTFLAMKVSEKAGNPVCGTLLRMTALKRC